MDRDGQMGHVGPTLSLYIYIYEGEEERGSREREILILILFLFASFFDICSFDSRNSSGQERKFIHSTRATREYKKHGISPRIQVRSSENLKFRYFLRSTAF